MAEARIPSPPASEIAAVNSDFEIHIMVPPIIGYWIPNLSVTSF
jgi:hypothetical protein